ncbi:sigma-70 family RNA polymerase sigma factor [Streptomyces sp. SID2131]|nr:sigma-70 family RNA polymerase sigma factor [Streptomyces sp. SID2131]
MHSDERRTTALVEAAKAGDVHARDELVRAFLPLVHNIVGRALDGHADTDDIVQETMVRVLGGLPGLRDPARFRSWLVAIAMNGIRRRWRERRQAPVPGLDRAADLADPAGDFTELTILRLGLSGQRRDVARATRWLDEDDRELLALWWLEAAGELTRAELAEGLGVPPQHAAVRVQRMKERLETGRAVVRALDAHQRFGAHMARLVADRRAAPGDDVTSRMLAFPEPFTDEEYALDLMAVTAAGHLTTADWLGNSLRLMLTEDAFADSMAGGRRSVSEATTEVLWEDAPTQILAGRWAVRDTRLGGQHIRAGDMLLLGLGAANTDPLIRQGARNAHGGSGAHLAFSHGEYRCPFPAQEIAEIIVRTGIEVLLDRLPDLELAVPAGELVRRPSAFLRGTTSLPVRFTPVRTTGDLS